MDVPPDPSRTLLPDRPEARSLRVNAWRDRLANIAWEWYLGIATRGIVDIRNGDAYPYATMSYRSIGRILDALSLSESDTFVDIGSGKGRVLCLAARQPLKSAIGIELSPELAAIARRNLARLRGRRAPSAVTQGYAQDFDYALATVCVLFNPFGADTLRAVLARLQHTPAARDGRLRIAYANPQHAAVMAEQRWLTCTQSWQAGDNAAEHEVHIYQARAQA